ncbi:hypothetical protein LTR10_011142 [Elasticomyces elasticus]|nr:hypothetical protein LTR10_011142 [Elasticomyces elasticus]KAK4966438.1 hypothetical protein LTR42_011603 [Elasticomyces elasticus]
MAADTKEASEILSPSKLEAQIYKPEDEDKRERDPWFNAYFIVQLYQIVLGILRHPCYPPCFDDPKYGPAWFQHGLLNILYAAAFFSMMNFVLKTFDCGQARYGGFFNTKRAKVLKVLLAVGFGISSYLDAQFQMGDWEPLRTLTGRY